MKLHSIFAVLILMTSVSLLPARAALVEDLYSTELAVPDQTTSSRLQVFNQAFKLVIVKVAGSNEVLSHPGLKRPLSKSARYVRQYRYLVRKDDDPEAFDGGQLFLRVAFNQELLESLLRENGISVWGRERPSTLLLINFDENKNASLVSSDTTPDLVEELETLASQQGLPVLFPLLDLEDRMVLGVQDVINSNVSSIADLSKRYSPDVVLSGQVIGRVGKGWSGDWQVRFSDKLYTWSFKAGSRQDVLKQVMTRLSTTLANEYALQTTQSLEQVTLFSVDQMTSLTDHIKVQNYLRGLDAVESLRLVLIEEDKVTYRVKLRNSVEDLHRLISLGYMLEQLELPQINAATDDQTVMLNYRFNQ